MFPDTFKGLSAESAQALRDLGPRWSEDIVANRKVVLDIYTPVLSARSLEGIEAQRNVAYGPHERQVLDIYHASCCDRPQGVVLFVHGGAFIRGDKDANEHIYANFLTYFVRHGYIGINLEYRQAPEATYPGSVADVNYGLRWLKTNAERFNTRADWVGAMGTSSGGHLAVLSAMKPSDSRYREIPTSEKGASQDAHAAFGAGGNTARGDRCDRPAGEADTGIGDVLMLTGDRRTDRVDAFDRTVDQGEDQIEVVDHQIEDDGHIGAARFERRDACRFDIERRSGARGHRLKGGGESLQMTHLENDIAVLRQGSQFVRLRQGRGYRLFDQHMLAGPQRGRGDSMVGIRRGGDDQRVDLGQQFLECHVRRACLPAHGLRALLIAVMDADKCGTFGRGDFQRVVAAEMSGAGDADAEFGGIHGKTRVCLVVFYPEARTPAIAAIDSILWV
jgi:hypothetical protein